MPALDSNEINTSDKCGTQTRKKNILRHKTRCSAGTFYCTQCPNFSTTSQVGQNYHIAKKHATPRVRKKTHKCKNCFKEFSGFYALRQHKTSEHGFQMKSAEFDVSNLFEDDDADLKEEFQACQPFLVDSELDKGRHRVFNLAISTFYNSLINKKLVLVYKGFKCAAEVNLALGFVLKTLKIDLVDIFMLRKTLRFWRGRNLCVRQTTI